MARITNLGNTPLEFLVKGTPNKDNVPPTKAIGPGETGDVDESFPQNARRLRSLVNANSIREEQRRDTDDKKGR